MKKIPHKEYRRSDVRSSIFKDLVTDDAKYDLKSKTTSDGTPSYAAIVIGEYSILEGTLRRYDDYGNISFGVFGLAAGFTNLELLRGPPIPSVFPTEPFGYPNKGKTV